MRWRQCGGCGGTCVELGYDGTAARAMENVNSYALTSIHLAWKAAFPSSATTAAAAVVAELEQTLQSTQIFV